MQLMSLKFQCCPIKINITLKKLDGCCPIRIHVTLKKLEGMLSNQNSCYVKEVRRNVVQSEFMLH